MQRLTTRDFLAQAQASIDQHDWPLFMKCLQQILAEAKADQPLHPDSTEWDAILEDVLLLALQVLETEDFQARREIIKIFPGLGTRAIAPLIAVFGDEEEEPDVRWFAARSLGEFCQPEVLSAVIELLQTSDSEFLEEMIPVALAGCGVESISALGNLLEESSTRLLATKVLSRINHPNTIPLFLGIVNDPQVAVRVIAVETLIQFRDPRVVSVAVAALSDPASPVRIAAASGLSVRADMQNELDVVALIKPLLWDLDVQVCQQAAIALARLKTDEAVAALSDVLQSPHTPPPLQIAVIKSLSWIETQPALDAIRHVLAAQATACDTSEVVLTAVNLLGRVKAPLFKSEIAQFLVDLLHSNQPAVQQNVMVKQSLALALGQLGNVVALEPLIRLLADEDGGVRLHAIAALKTLAPDAAHQRLKELSHNPDLVPELRHGVAIALHEWPA